MLAKHIDKVKDDPIVKKHYNKDISAEDEWSHVTGIDSKKPPNPDPMSPQDRVITFINKFSNLTKEEIVKAKSEKFKDQVSSTDQYFRFANGLIKEKMTKLQQLKDSEKRFQDTVDMLQNKIKSRFDLDNLNLKQMTPDDAKSLIFHLEDEFERLKDKLLYQELIVQKTKDEIARKRKQVQQIKEDLKDLLHNTNKPPQTDPVSILREELKKAGVSESSRIFAILDEIASYLDIKNSEKTQR